MFMAAYINFLTPFRAAYNRINTVVNEQNVTYFKATSLANERSAGVLQLKSKSLNSRLHLEIASRMPSSTFSLLLLFH